jgi:hypothetical protein
MLMVTFSTTMEPDRLAFTSGTDSMLNSTDGSILLSLMRECRGGNVGVTCHVGGSCRNISAPLLLSESNIH